jgi:hypothetical protein
MPAAGKAVNIVSPITFIDRLIKKSELGQPFALTDHQREVLRLCLRLRSGRPAAVGYDQLQLHQEERQPR